jgi:hypothetical protein
MSNFEKKLEDASEEDLRRWINEQDFRVVPLVSDELTRRSLKRLQKTIQDLDKNTMRYSRRLIDLTILLFFVAFCQVFISIMTVPLTWLARILLGMIVLYSIYFITRRIIEKKN